LSEYGVLLSDEPQHLEHALSEERRKSNRGCIIALVVVSLAFIIWLILRWTNQWRTRRRSQHLPRCEFNPPWLFNLQPTVEATLSGRRERTL